MELEALDRAKANLLKRANLESIPKSVQAKADQNRQSACPDDFYLSALRSFHDAASKRKKATAAEFGVYHEWIFSEKIGLISTNSSLDPHK
jgi:hypothetical protein